MARRKAETETETRQLYASIREDLYLAAKARAAEMRIPLREFLEMALERALAEEPEPADEQRAPSIWDDEYLGMQAARPLGSPVELTKEEAEKLVRSSFGAGSVDRMSDQRQGRGPDREPAHG